MLTDLRSAQAVRRDTRPEILLGGVAIPERHPSDNQEQLRLIAKKASGCALQVSQVVQDSNASKDLVSDSFYTCRERAPACKLMLKWPNLYYSTSALGPKHCPKLVIDYANTRGADRIIYAGCFPSGLTLDRIFGDMPSVPFRDRGWHPLERGFTYRVLMIDSARIQAVTVLVDDYDLAIAHYVGDLGFVLLEDTQLHEAKRWVRVAPSRGGATCLLLAQASTPEQRSLIGRQAGGRVQFFLHVANFEGEYSRLRAAGVQFTGEPRDEAYGRVVVFADRYGNLWDLVQASQLHD